LKEVVRKCFAIHNNVLAELGFLLMRTIHINMQGRVLLGRDDENVLVFNSSSSLLPLLNQSKQLAVWQAAHFASFDAYKRQKRFRNCLCNRSKLGKMRGLEVKFVLPEWFLRLGGVLQVDSNVGVDSVGIFIIGQLALDAVESDPCSDGPA
jgi:hypothetical protein